MENFKSGFIAITGSPNVGKSTLINAIVAKKIAIVSKKPQTTRSRITGILTGEDFQMIFVDTPGFLQPKNRLDEFMAKTTEQAAKDVDAVVFVVDAKKGVGEKDSEKLAALSKSKIPMVIALNKIDAVDKRRADELTAELKEYEYPVFLISAKESLGIGELVSYLKRYLVDGPMYYPAEMTSDQPDKVIAGELIREQALKSLGKEIPHGVGVGIEKFQQDPNKSLLNIDAVIYCEKDSHKGIIIGSGGSRLKKIASAARESMQLIFEEKVFLQIWVKVKPNWRNSIKDLRSLGYREN